MSNENANPQHPENANPNPQRTVVVRGGSARRQQNAAPTPPVDNAEAEEQPSVIVEEDTHAEPSRPAVAGSNARPVDRTRSIERVRANTLTPTTPNVENGAGDGGGSTPAAPQSYDDFAPSRRSRGWLWAAIALALVLGIVAIFLGANSASKEKLDDLVKKVDDPVTGLDQKATASGVRKLLEENYYTKTDIDGKFVSTEMLTQKGYATTKEVDDKLKGYATTKEVDDKLKGYAKTTEVDDKFKTAWRQLKAREAKAVEDLKKAWDDKLKGYATKGDLEGFVTKGDLDELTKVRVEVRDTRNGVRDTLTVP